MDVDIWRDAHGHAWQVDRQRGKVVGPATDEQLADATPRRPRPAAWKPRHVDVPGVEQLRLFLDDARRELERGRAA